MGTAEYPSACAGFDHVAQLVGTLHWTPLALDPPCKLDWWRHPARPCRSFRLICCGLVARASSLAGYDDNPTDGSLPHFIIKNSCKCTHTCHSCAGMHCAPAQHPACLLAPRSQPCFLLPFHCRGGLVSDCRRNCWHASYEGFRAGGRPINFACAHTAALHRVLSPIAWPGCCRMGREGLYQDWVSPWLDRQRHLHVQCKAHLLGILNSDSPPPPPGALDSRGANRRSMLPAVQQAAWVAKTTGEPDGPASPPPPA